MPVSKSGLPTLNNWSPDAKSHASAVAFFVCFKLFAYHYELGRKVEGYSINSIDGLRYQLSFPITLVALSG